MIFGAADSCFRFKLSFRATYIDQTGALGGGAGRHWLQFPLYSLSIRFLSSIINWRHEEEMELN